MHSPQRLGPIPARPQLRGEVFEEHQHPRGLDVLDADAIDPGSALIRSHVAPRPPHNVAAGDLVEHGVEPTLGILLGTAIEHALESSNAVPATGRADGTSRTAGTHQRPSLPNRAWMKQGSFAPAGLCCPDHQHYYDPLRLPLGYRSFRGAAAYRPMLLRSPAGTGPRRVSPVPRTTV